MVDAVDSKSTSSNRVLVRVQSSARCNMKPLISVLLCSTLNPQRKQSLHKALQSVVDQTYPHIELLIVHNGSDRSLKQILPTVPIVSRYYYLEQKNLGAARAFGVQVASGEYIAYLDDDDVLEPNKLEAQLNFLQKHALDFVACNAVLEGDTPRLLVDDKQGKFTYKKAFATPFWEKTTEGMILKRSSTLLDVLSFPSQPSGWLVKASLLQTYPCKTVFYGEDWDQLMALGHHGISFGFLNEPLIKVTFDGLNMSLTHFEKKFESIKQLRLFWLSQSKDFQTIKKLKKELAHTLRAYGLACAETKDFKKAQALYQESLKYHLSFVSLKQFFKTLIQKK